MSRVRVTHAMTGEVVTELDVSADLAARPTASADPVDAAGHAGIDGAAPLVRPLPTGAIEVVVDGWRFEFVVEDAARADLRARATRLRDATGRHGPTEVRARIPGRVASVAVTPGDQVEAGQRLLSVEAMKMENEVRSPRPGTVERVAVAVGGTVELGDVLVVIG